jgi:hypothetical protein
MVICPCKLKAAGFPEILVIFTVMKPESYRTPRRTLSQLEKYNFSGEREKTTGRAMQSHQKNNETSPLSLPFYKIDV